MPNSLTGTLSNVNDASSDTEILASNGNRKGAMFFNDSTEILYLALAAGTSSATAFSVKLDPGAFYELPLCEGGVYSGIVKGIWAANGAGAVRVTEWT